MFRGYPSDGIFTGSEFEHRIMWPLRLYIVYVCVSIYLSFQHHTRRNKRGRICGKVWGARYTSMLQQERNSSRALSTPTYTIFNPKLNYILCILFLRGLKEKLTCICITTNFNKKIQSKYKWNLNFFIHFVVQFVIKN